jgi:hypothetical protein
MCVGCQQRAPKHTLIRLTLNTDGNLDIDVGNTASGRGAWLCQKDECLRKAIERKAFQRALRSPVRLDGTGDLRTNVRHALTSKVAMAIRGAQRAGVLRNTETNEEADVVIEGTTPPSGWVVSDSRWLQSVQAALEQEHRWTEMMIGSGQSGPNPNGRC